MRALIKSALYSLVTIVLVTISDIRAITETMVTTSVQPAYQTLLINTLLPGAIMPFFEDTRVDLDYFRDKEPEPLDLEEEDEPFWLWLLKKLQANPEMSEDDITKMIVQKHLAEAGLDDFTTYGIPDRNLIVQKPSVKRGFTVPGTYNYGGGDSDKDQKKTSDNEKSDDSDSQKDTTKSNGDSATISESSASATSAEASLQVVDDAIRPQVTTALERFQKKKVSVRNWNREGILKCMQ